METVQVIEGNKLLFQFMAWQIEKGMEKEPDPYYNSPTGFNMVLASAARFNSSWDWLMPVVVKIKDFLNSMERPSKNHCCKGDFIEVDIQCHLWSIDIENVYLQVVEFVKWYNTPEK